MCSRAYASTLMLLLAVLEPVADVPLLSAYAFNMFKVCASSRAESVCWVESVPSVLSLLLASSVAWWCIWPMCGRPVGAVSLVLSVALAVASLASVLLSVALVPLVAALALVLLVLLVALVPSVAEMALLFDVSLDELLFSALKIAALACLAS
jgi:hypothetical protein